MGKVGNKRPSESFILGVVALVFLVIGYQVAMFVYRASVTKITANRDEPDTVFVYQRDSILAVAAQEGYEDMPLVSPDEPIVITSKSKHSRRAEAIRSNVPRKKVESFRFNPNTISENDLCRLGFSQKQARSIVNYRNKGGRFRRKSDFSKSFVVADSVYKRLEPFIDIPLVDLNLADSAALDALPGIGGWFANKIIEHRRSLKGYSYKEQLMDIWNFDQEKYDALSDLVVVSEEYMTPYPIWSFPVDSLRKHPYIGNYETARAIVLYRENAPSSQWTIESLSQAGIIKNEIASKLSRCKFVEP